MKFNSCVACLASDTSKLTSIHPTRVTVQTRSVNLILCAVRGPKQLGLGKWCHVTIPCGLATSMER